VALPHADRSSAIRTTRPPKREKKPFSPPFFPFFPFFPVSRPSFRVYQGMGYGNPSAFP